MFQGGKERRRHPRSREGLAIPEAGPRDFNYIHNVSESGALGATQEQVAVMTMMRITFELPAPHARAIDCEGVVVRCLPDKQAPGSFQVGITFTRIDEEDVAALREFVESTGA